MTQWKVRIRSLADMDFFEVYRKLPDGSEECLGKFNSQREAYIVCDKANLKEYYAERRKNAKDRT